MGNVQLQLHIDTRYSLSVDFDTKHFRFVTNMHNKTRQKPVYVDPILVH